MGTCGVAPLIQTPNSQMRKKSLLKRIFKRRKKKLKVDSKKASVFEKFKLLVKKDKSIIKSFFKKNLKSDKSKDIKKFFVMIIGYGLILNYSLHFIFGIKFNVFTIFAWGIMYFFVREEFVEWFRGLIAKR